MGSGQAKAMKRRMGGGKNADKTSADRKADVRARKAV